MKQLPPFVAAATMLLGTSAVVAQDTPVTVKLGEQNNSGETGTATFTPRGDKTQVVLQISGAPAAAAQPVHIHAGSCAKLDPTPRIPLQNVTNGKSTTVLDMPIAKVMSAGGAINVHKSAEDVKTYVACGDLK